MSRGSKEEFKSGDRHRIDVGESYERTTSRRVSNDQKGYRDRESHSTRRTDIDQPVEPRTG